MKVNRDATDSRGRLLFLAALYIALSVLLVSVLIPLNAFRAEFSDPDEPAHAVTGIMIYDYLRTGLWQTAAPMPFAEAYYDHYPKVALGHWPPLMYALEAMWMLVTGVSRTSLILFPLLIAAMLGVFAAWLCLREGMTRWKAALAGFATVLLPEVLYGALYVRSDGLTAVMTLLAAIAAERWLTRWDARSGVTFGLVAAVAVLTKGTAFALLPAVAIATLFRRGFRALKQPVFWLPALTTAAIALPWYWFTWDMVSDEIVMGRSIPFLSRVSGAVASNTINLVGLAGWPAAILTLYSLRAGLAARAPAITALLPGLLIFLGVMSPHSEPRLLLAAAPVLLFSAMIAIRSLHPAFAVGALVLTLTAAHIRTPVHAKELDGFVKAVAWTDTNIPPDATFLIASGRFGEGSWIAETAMRKPHPEARVLRASKVLMKSTWMGEEVRVLVDGPESIRNVIAKEDVDYVVVHDGAAHAPYAAWLDQLLSDWNRVAEFGDLRIFAVPPDAHYNRAK